jgi:hypothetical protein
MPFVRVSFVCKGFSSDGKRRARAMKLRVATTVSEAGSTARWPSKCEHVTRFDGYVFVKPRMPARQTFALGCFKGSPELIDAERNEIV